MRSFSKSVHTISSNNFCMVELRLPSQSPSSYFSLRCNLCNFGVCKTPWEKIFIFGHSLTITCSKHGNSRALFPIQKLLRLGKQWSPKYFSWLKTIQSFSTSPTCCMICCIILQSVTFILSRFTSLSAVEIVIKFISLPHFDTSRVDRFPKDTEDGTNISNLLHSFWKTFLGWEVSLHSQNNLGNLDSLSSFRLGNATWG